MVQRMKLEVTLLCKAWLCMCTQPGIAANTICPTLSEPNTLSLNVTLATHFSAFDRFPNNTELESLSGATLGAKSPYPIRRAGD